MCFHDTHKSFDDPDMIHVVSLFSPPKNMPIINIVCKVEFNEGYRYLIFFDSAGI